MTELDFLYSLAYAVFAILLILPPTEFISAGLTVQNMLGRYLGSEQLNFIGYHMRRTTATVIIHAMLPFGYYVFMGFAKYQEDLNFMFPFSLSLLWRLYLILSLVVLFAALALTLHWSRDKWCRHPIARRLAKLAPQGSGWQGVASSVNVEFRRVDKFTTGPPGRRLIVTDSWIILTAAYTLKMAYQRDIHLSIEGSDAHDVHYESSVGAQFLNILVTGVNTKPFHIRLNASEYTDLKDKLSSPILNVRNIVIQQSLPDRFLESFKRQVQLNGVVQKTPEMELEPCIGCMLVESNVKLVKQCGEPDEGRCLQCYCRPMWCIDCMGKWYASRQDQSQPDTWLGSTSPCPTCRATFCMLDICRLV